MSLPFELENHLDLSKQGNFNKLIVFRLIWAMTMTNGMVHPDENWQATEPAYKFAFGDMVDVNLPWEWHESYRLRSTVYVWYLALSLKLLRFLDLDYPLVVSCCPYVMQAILLLTADWHFYHLASSHIG